MGAPLGDGKHCPCCQGPRKPRPTRPTESAPCTVCLPPGMQSHSWRAFSAAHLRPIVTLHFANREPTGHSTMWKRDFYTSNLWHKWVPISKGLMRPVGREAGAPDPPQPAEADDAPPRHLQEGWSEDQSEDGNLSESWGIAGPPLREHLRRPDSSLYRILQQTHQKLSGENTV